MDPDITARALRLFGQPSGAGLEPRVAICAAAVATPVAGSLGEWADNLLAALARNGMELRPIGPGRIVRLARPPGEHSAAAGHAPAPGPAPHPAAPLPGFTLTDAHLADVFAGRRP